MLARERYRRDPEPWKARSQRYREENPEKVKQWSRAWAQENPEKMRAAVQRHKEANPDKIREWAARNYQQNRERIRKARSERQRQWRIDNPILAKEQDRLDRQRRHEYFNEYSRRRRALKLGVTVGSPFSLQQIFERDGRVCHICGERVTRREASMDHLIPLSKGGEHSAINVSLAHLRCNSRRQAGITPAQLRLIG